MADGMGAPRIRVTIQAVPYKASVVCTRIAFDPLNCQNFLDILYHSVAILSQQDFVVDNCGRMIILGEARLRYLISEYAQHYHRARAHQGLDGYYYGAPTPRHRQDHLLPAA
jgi:hypothetical protein